MIVKRLNLQKSMILDPANVGALIKIKEEFFDTLKLDSFFDTSKEKFWLKAEFLETELRDLMFEITGEKMICKRTVVSTHYIDWFIKICKAFFEEKSIKREDLRYFENKIKDSPMIIVYRDLGMLLAPRIDRDGDDEYGFKDYKELKKKKV